MFFLPFKRKLFLFVVIEKTIVICSPGFVFAVHSGLFMLALHLIFKYFFVDLGFLCGLRGKKRLIFRETCHLQCLVRAERLPLSWCFCAYREYISEMS